MKVCFYCGATVTQRTGIGDHMPIPKRHGGTHVVDCCVTCHDMKDRVSLKNVHINWFADVMKCFPSLNREGRIFMAQLMAMYYDMREKNNSLDSRLEDVRKEAAFLAGILKNSESLSEEMTK